jgi:hypothetical protein
VTTTRKVATRRKPRISRTGVAASGRDDFAAAAVAFVTAVAFAAAAFAVAAAASGRDDLVAVAVAFVAAAAFAVTAAAFAVTAAAFAVAAVVAAAFAVTAVAVRAAGRVNARNGLRAPTGGVYRSRGQVYSESGRGVVSSAVTGAGAGAVPGRVRSGIVRTP